MKRDTFSDFHPLVNLLYFVAVIGFSMFFLHPLSLLLSLFSALMYTLYLNGGKKTLWGMKFLIPMLLFTALLNPLFNHRGATILAYLPNGNPLTLESSLYGLFAGVMLVTVITWFSCFHKVMSSDKFIYLFGRIIPALSLVLSMALRFVPRFREQITVISHAQKGIGRDVKSGNILQRARQGIRILSILVTWALENAIETADSMKGRGYGLKGRTAFSIFRFDKRDMLALFFLCFCIFTILLGFFMGVYRFLFFPWISAPSHNALSFLVFTLHFALLSFPIILNIKEDLLWKRIKSKM